MNSKTNKKNFKQYISISLIIFGLIGIIILAIIYNDSYIWLILSAVAIFIGILWTFIIYSNNEHLQKSKKGNNGIEDFHEQKLFELAVYVRTIAILIPIVGLLLTFLGYTTKQDIENKLLTKINAKGKLDTLDMCIAEGEILLDSLQNYENRFPPIGSIVAYDGKLPLPDGWAICNGDLKEFFYPDGIKIKRPTPNLLNKFIRGVIDNSEVGQEDGVEKHTHSLIIDEFSTLQNEPKIGKSKEYCILYQDGNTNPKATIFNASHKHQIDFPKNVETQATNSLPPYYTLVYIIRYK